MTRDENCGATIPTGRMLEQRPGDGISRLQLAGRIHETSPKRNPSLSLTPSRGVGANL